MAPPADPPASAASVDGEVAAWMAAYGPALRRYFRKRLGPAEADDLVQEVFLRLQARAGVQAVDNVERYLFRIANNVLISRHRYDNAQVRRLDEAVEAAFERADDISPERVLIGRQTLSQLAVVVHQLPPRTREAFVLHRFEEMTYEAVARRMGISLSVVERHIQRAMGHINAQMGPRA